MGQVERDGKTREQGKRAEEEETKIDLNHVVKRNHG